MRATIWVAIEAVIFTLGVGVGVVLLRNFDAQPDDWLGFAGALIGAAVTVLGAMLVVEFQASATERSRRRLLTDQIQDIRRWIEKVRNPDVGAGTDVNVIRAANADHLTAAIERLKTTRQWVTPDNAAMVQALAVIEKMPDRVQVWWGNHDEPTYVAIETIEDGLKDVEANVVLATSLLKSR